MQISQLLLAILLMMLAPSKLYAGYKMYLKIDGVIGESKDPGREGWIDILAYDHGLSLPHLTSGGRSTVDFMGFYVTKKIDKTSPLVWLRAVKGTNYNKVKFECVCDDVVPKLLFTYDFETVFIRGVYNSYSPPPLNPPATYVNHGLIEQIIFSFARINWKVTSTDANGVTTTKIAYWDLLSNTGG